jgi:hypothetical protein
MRSTCVQRTDSLAIGWHAMHRPQQEPMGTDPHLQVGRAVEQRKVDVTPPGGVDALALSVDIFTLLDSM